MHFNNDIKDTYLSPPKLFKIYPVMSYPNRKFQNLYIPDQNIATDESLTQWKGRLSFTQYIPLKPSKFEFQSYDLCKFSSGYLQSFIIYTIRDTRFQSTLISEEKTKTAIVVGPLLGKGNILWMDNFLMHQHWL
jgi:hypothetical protein